MAQYLLDKAYRVRSSVLAARAVVQSDRAGECSYPASANASRLLGISLHGQNDLGRGVMVRRTGIAEVTAAGAIAVGAPVNIADANGKVKALNEACGTRVEVLGFAKSPASGNGDLIKVLISIHQRTL